MVSKKQLQEQIARLENQLEELRLEREESKKNVLHFMQEADAARQQMQAAMAQLAQRSEDELDERLWHNKEHEANIIKMEEQLAQVKHENAELKEMLEAERERADTMERRWQASEHELEQVETHSRALQTELEKLRQQEWAVKLPQVPMVEKSELDAKVKALEALETQLEQCQAERDAFKHQLAEKSRALDALQQQFSEKMAVLRAQEDQTQALEQARIRENHLKTVNKTLRDEIRKLSGNSVEVNIEYLRNVIIGFLEKKQTRPQLIPVLSTLLQCSREEQIRLNKLVRNNKVSY